MVGFLVVWVLGFVVLAVLLLMLRGVMREEERRLHPPFQEVRRTLLFVYDPEGAVRASSEGEVAVYMPAKAWLPEWEEDLLRVELTTCDPSREGDVPVGEGWVVVYDVQIYRMTETGTDVPVETLEEPAVLIYVVGAEEEALAGVVYDGERWISTDAPTVTREMLEQFCDPDACRWVAVPIYGSGRVGVVR